MKKKLLIALIVVVIGTSILLIYKLSSEKPDRGILLLSGNVEVTEMNIGFDMPGRVAKLFVDEGQTVEKGEKLAVLDNMELERQVEHSGAYLKEALVRLEELRAGSRPQEIGQARANVAYAEAELENAKKDYERAEILFKNGAISAQQMDAAKKHLR
ncbi:MAG: biotin/lipoyl-binding protein [Nitrospirota bacterium]